MMPFLPLRRFVPFLITTLLLTSQMRPLRSSDSSDRDVVHEWLDDEVSITPDDCEMWDESTAVDNSVSPSSSPVTEDYFESEKDFESEEEFGDDEEYEYVENLENDDTRDPHSARGCRSVTPEYRPATPDHRQATPHFRPDTPSYRLATPKSSSIGTRSPSVDLSSPKFHSVQPEHLPSQPEL